MRHNIHSFGTDLNFKRHRLTTDERRMQCLISVDLRYGDVIFELALSRLIKRVHNSQDAITSVQGIDNDAKPQYIHYVGERFLACPS